MLCPIRIRKRGRIHNTSCLSQLAKGSNQPECLYLTGCPCPLNLKYTELDVVRNSYQNTSYFSELTKSSNQLECLYPNWLSLSFKLELYCTWCCAQCLSVTEVVFSRLHICQNSQKVPISWSVLYRSGCPFCIQCFYFISSYANIIHYFINNEF